MRDSTETAKRLFDIADAQQGFFTAKQAKDAGYFEQSIGYHVEMGNWIREHRGIYRLANYPQTERPDLMLWYLWSRNRNEEPQGVYSHDTALALHDLSDINPDRLHMTVPKGFRRSSEIPNVLHLHVADLSPSDAQQMLGVAVTRPMRTILDIADDETFPRDLLKQAVSEALKRGLITRRQIRESSAVNTAFADAVKGLSI